jgi:glycosyltransferase involved in cell wall biosynthesis
MQGPNPHPREPKVSVALATCDGERWIGEQLESILAQLGPGDEVVVADASSSDGTLRIVEGFGDPRVRILRDLPRGNIPATFERALGECQGDVLFLSDQDDVWLGGKVEQCLAALERPGACMVLHDARVVDDSGRILAESFLAHRRFKPGFLPNLWRPGYLGCALAFRRELLAHALPFPRQLPMHDWWLGLLAERHRGLEVVRIPLILHRRHGSNANFEPGNSPYGPVRRLRFRLRMAGEILLRSLRR